MTLTAAEVRSLAKSKVATIPTALTDATIDTFVEDSHREVENFTGVSIDTTAIPEQYATVLVDMVQLQILEYSTQNTVTESISIAGDITINASDIATSNGKIISRLEKRIEKKLNMLGVHRDFQYTEV